MQEITENEMRALVQRIIASGELGRSKTYGAILRYLMECSLSGEQPKEMAIAVDVLGREADFDVGRDSIVRVHLYHLRNKLDNYFEGPGRAETWRLEVPRGQYLLTARPNAQPTPATEEALPEGSSPAEATQDWQRWLYPALSAVLALLLTVSLVLRPDGVPESGSLDAVAQAMPWRALLEDQAPIMIVASDYFIFGEVDESGNITRMIRDFAINSSEDLEMHYLLEPETAEQYYNLELSYLPTGVAEALMQVMPVLAGERERLRFSLASELDAEDLNGHHILYLGYISGLGLLEQPVFAGSGLQPGQTYDELVTATGERYNSNAGRQGFRGEFRDYGLLSTFPSPGGHQVVIIAGMRDEGLERVARESTRLSGLNGVGEVSGEAADRAWEMLLEVRGRDQASFTARQVYTGELQTGRIWGGEN